MQEDNLVEYRNPGIALPVADALTEVLRRGASMLLQQAVEAEVAEYVAQYLELKDELGRQRVVRNGHLPERRVQTGIGEVTVKGPRVRDRGGELKFSSSILPPYLRRTRSLEELLPWLYLKGLSTTASTIKKVRIDINLVFAVSGLRWNCPNIPLAGEF